MTDSQSAIIGNSIATAKAFLDANQLVAIPTETVYGLAGNALQEAAVIKIFETKNRPSFDPLIVHTHDFSAFSNYAKNIPVAAKTLFEKIGPGPITYILEKKDNIPDLVTSGLMTVGLRVPQHPLTLSLLRQLPYPLAAPSANPFGYVSPTSAWHVNTQLGKKIPYILNGGACAVGIESTIIDFTQSAPVILRLGGMDSETLALLIGTEIKINTTSSSQPAAPGMLHSHYAPSKPVTLIPPDTNLVKHETEKIGFLGFQTYHPDIPVAHQLLLAPSGSLQEAAKNLFAYLRQFEEMDIDQIYTTLVPEEGLGRGINDRLRRAAH